MQQLFLVIGVGGSVMEKIKSVYIAHSALFINGELVLKGENSIFVKFLKEVYKYTGIKYT